MKLKDQLKDSKRSLTWLVFFSGNIIYSSWDISLMKEDYEKFMKILQTGKEEIMEKLED